MLTCSECSADAHVADGAAPDTALGPRLRFATAADSADLLAVLAPEAGAPRDRLAARLAALLASPDDAVLLATGRLGSVFGWLHLRAAAHPGACAEVRGLGIAPCARGAGIGAALLGAAERWAQQRGGAGVIVRGGSLLLDGA